MAPDTVRLLGEGGVEWEFELPLAETYADQVKAHTLRPADDKSAAALADLLAPAAPAEDGSDEQPKEQTLDERIDAVATHAQANALAADLKVEGFEDKKPALDAKKAALREAAAASAAE